MMAYYKTAQMYATLQKEKLRQGKLRRLYYPPNENIVQQRPILPTGPIRLFAVCCLLRILHSILEISKSKIISIY